MSRFMDNLQEKSYYPILFMILTTALFVGAISYFYHSSEQRIETNKIRTYHHYIIELFADSLANDLNLSRDVLLTPDKTEEIYVARVKTISTPIQHFEISGTHGLIGYCFDITGGGLWGTMHGLVALSPDLSTIINFTIYQQEETPGLGARVAEDWFKAQFRNKPIITGTHVIPYLLVSEDEKAPKANEMRQITGATITSSSVAKMLLHEMQRILKQFPPTSLAGHHEAK